jgi:adenine-specific DNA methylase
MNIPNTYESLRPAWLKRIDELNHNYEVLSERLAHCVKKQEKAYKTARKAVVAEKAFFICACNRDRVGCEKWFDKTNERQLLALEEFEKLVQETDEDTKMTEVAYLHYSDNFVKKFHTRASNIMKEYL